MWTRRDECKDIIKVAWNESVNSDTLDGIAVGFKHCANDSSRWNRSVFGHVLRQIQNKRKILSDLVLMDQNRSNGSEINKIRKEINDLKDCEEIMWQQRSKV